MAYLKWWNFYEICIDYCGAPLFSSHSAVEFGIEHFCNPKYDIYSKLWMMCDVQVDSCKRMNMVFVSVTMHSDWVQIEHGYWYVWCETVGIETVSKLMSTSEQLSNVWMLVMDVNWFVFVVWIAWSWSRIWADDVYYDVF